MNFLPSSPDTRRKNLHFFTCFCRRRRRRRSCRRSDCRHIHRETWRCIMSNAWTSRWWCCCNGFLKTFGHLSEKSNSSGPIKKSQKLLPAFEKGGRKVPKMNFNVWHKKSCRFIFCKHMFYPLCNTKTEDLLSLHGTHPPYLATWRYLGAVHNFGQLFTPSPFVTLFVVRIQYYRHNTLGTISL